MLRPTLKMNRSMVTSKLRLVTSKGDEQSELRQVAPDRPLIIIIINIIIIMMRVMIIHKHDDDDDESKKADICENEVDQILGRTK